MKPSSLDWIWVLLGVSRNDRTINKLMGEINKKNSEDKFSKENQEPKNSNYSDLLLKKLWEQHIENKKKKKKISNWYYLAQWHQLRTKILHFFHPNPHHQIEKPTGET